MGFSSPPSGSTGAASHSWHVHQLMEVLGYAYSTSSGPPRNIGGAVLPQARAAERLHEPHYPCDDAAKRARVWMVCRRDISPAGPARDRRDAGASLSSWGWRCQLLSCVYGVLPAWAQAGPPTSEPQRPALQIGNAVRFDEDWSVLRGVDLSKTDDFWDRVQVHPAHSGPDRVADPRWAGS